MIPGPRSVVIVDDHPLFRRGLIQLLNSVGGFRLVGEAANGRDGIDLVRRVRPDILLLDLNMKDMSGLDVLRAIKASDPDIRVVMATVSDQADDLVAALRGGADGDPLKDMEPEQMMDSLEAAAAGRVIVSEALTHLLAAAIRQHNRPENTGDAGLTEQEKRILELIAGGLSNKVIGKELDIAEGTVKVHVKHILRKLGPAFAGGSGGLGGRAPEQDQDRLNPARVACVAEGYPAPAKAKHGVPELRRCLFFRCGDGDALPLGEFFRGVDAAQAQGVVAHGDLDQHRQVAADRHRDAHFRHLDAQDFAVPGLHVQAIHRLPLFGRGQVDDELDVLLVLDGGLAEHDGGC